MDTYVNYIGLFNPFLQRSGCLGIILYFEDLLETKIKAP